MTKSWTLNNQIARTQETKIWEIKETHIKPSNQELSQLGNQNILKLSFHEIAKSRFQCESERD